MIERRLKTQLGLFEHSLRQARRHRQLMWCWLSIAAAELLLFLSQGVFGWKTDGMRWIVVLSGLVAVLWVLKRERQRPTNYDLVVESIVKKHPDTRHLLRAAIQQKPDPATGEFSFMQTRVVDDVLRHPDVVAWGKDLEAGAKSARRIQLAALAVMLALFSFGSGLIFPHLSSHFARSASALFAAEIEVAPGDADLERGSGLVVTARFANPPSEATLVWVSEAGKMQRIPLARNLADPVFGASLLEVTESGVYRIEYNSRKTRDFKIAVFDYPSLTRADAVLIYPSYTALTNRTIRDTRRISAVEGTEVTFTLQLNKPVTQARFVARDESIPLSIQSNAIAVFGTHLTKTARYSLLLTDAQGRTNKAPSEFVLQTLPNKPPELKITFPKGDQRVSKLEEMQLQAEASDDFGLLRYGIGYGISGQPPQFIELGKSAPGTEKRSFTAQVSLEKLGAEVDQLFSYFVWAEDYGPDGEVRTTMSDIFFAEVRPFDEIFRPDQSGVPAEQGQSQGAGQGENQARLAETQKQIVVATWKLQGGRKATARGNTP